MKTCLLVDDSSVIRKVARRVLEARDVRISEAENGRDAIEICRAELPDAILVDSNMPLMDGVDFVKELRALPRGGEPRVVFCTIENDISCLARAMAAGANDYMLKPFDKDVIEAKFESVGLI